MSILIEAKLLSIPVDLGSCVIFAEIIEHFNILSIRMQFDPSYWVVTILANGLLLMILSVCRRG